MLIIVDKLIKIDTLTIRDNINKAFKSKGLQIGNKPILKGINYTLAGNIALRLSKGYKKDILKINSIL